jgi:hypothetical protein
MHYEKRLDEGWVINPRPADAAPDTQKLLNLPGVPKHQPGETEWLWEEAGRDPAQH